MKFLRPIALCAAACAVLSVTGLAGPLSERILFVANPTGIPKIYIVRPDGKDLMRLTRGLGPEREPQVSSAGKAVAYRGSRDGNEDIYRCNLKGDEIVQLTHDPAVDRQPTWSPDGKKIAFSTQRWGEEELAILDAEKGEQAELFRLTWDRAQSFFPVWSPQGDWIAYSSYRQGQCDLYLISPDGQKRRRLTQDRQPDVTPSWSPDGRKIVYQTQRGPRDLPVLAVYNLDDDSIRVLDIPEYAYYPNFSPDGLSILFLALGTRYLPKQPQLQIYELSTGDMRKFELPRPLPNSPTLFAQESEWSLFPYPW